MGRMKSSVEERTELSISRVIELARKIGTGMLVTEGSEGLRSRPMTVAEVTDEGALWFMTSITSPKVGEVEARRSVVVVMAESGKYLSITGDAELVRDPVKVRSLWAEPHRVWFKDASDPDLVLLKVEPTYAEYWDQSGWKGVKYAVRAAEAYIKGVQLRDTEPDLALHAKVRMHPER